MQTFDPSILLDRVREIVNTDIGPRASVLDERYEWPEHNLRALQAAGLGGLVVPQELGGLGHGMFMLARTCELIGTSCASTALCFGMHCVATAVIAAKATPRQADELLAPICAGKHITTLALSEPGTGAHFYFPRVSITPQEGGYRINGTKSFVTNGSHADSYVVSTAPSDPDAPPDQFSCVVVPASAEGLEWGPEWRGLGMRGNSSRTAKLQDVSIPSHCLLGEEGDQIWYVFRVVGPYFLIAMAGTYLGIAVAALQEAVGHMQARQYAHSGTGLADIPVLQHRLGCMWAVVERTRRLIYHAASEADEGGETALLALASAKAEVADCAVSVVNEAMTLCGGVSYRAGGLLERLMRDARAAHVMSPTTDILRTWVGRGLLGQPLLGD